MALYAQSADGAAGQGAISYYQLDFQHKGSQHHYLWRHHMDDLLCHERAALLINLNNIFVTDHEIEKLIFSIVLPAEGVRSVAFVHCHSYNQQEIRRKLKAGNLALFSNTMFFSDIARAEQWLTTQCANR